MQLSFTGFYVWSFMGRDVGLLQWFLTGSDQLWTFGEEPVAILEELVLVGAVEGVPVVTGLLLILGRLLFRELRH